MYSTFADPRNDHAFKHIFGNKEHKDVLILLLNALLGLKGKRKVKKISFLREEHRPVVEEMKFSIVDVKCTDGEGNTYVVEMQVLPTQGFMQRVVYNASKAYVHQLKKGAAFPSLNDVIAISICDFSAFKGPGYENVGLISRWRMHEEVSGARGLDHVRYVFLELGKWDTKRTPKTIEQKWAHFFTTAQTLDKVPEHLKELKEAFDAARMAGFTAEEREAYDRVQIAIMDEKGRTDLALEQGQEQGRIRGRAEGRAEGLHIAIESLCEVLGISLASDQYRRLGAKSAGELEIICQYLKQYKKLPPI